MKKILTVLCLGITTVFAQDEFKITKSAELKIKSDQTNYGVFPAGGGKMTGILYDPGLNIVFNKYDENAKLTGTTTADISGLTPNPLFEKILKVGENTYWFYSTHDKDADAHKLFAQKLDLAEGKFSGTPVTLVETTKLNGTGDFNFFNKYHKAGKYCLSLSGAGDILLVSYRKFPDIPDDSQSHLTHGLQVFNASLEKLWSREYKLPYTEEYSEAAAYAVDSKANAFVVVKVYEETVKEADGKRRLFHYEILGTDGKSEKFTVFNLKLDGKIINAISINQDNSGKLICAGFYTTQPRETVTDGAFMTQLDLAQSSKAKEQMHFYPYSGSVKKEIDDVKAFRKSKNRKEVKKPEDSNMLIDTILFHKDGSMTICAEEHHFFYAGNIEFNANYDIIAVNIKSDGELGWMKNVSRRKEELSNRKQPGNTGGPSLGRQRLPAGPSMPNAVRSFLINDELYFFYVDNDKNLTLQPGQVAAQHIGGHGGMLVSAHIDKSGAIKRSQVADFSKKGVGCDIDPLFLKQAGPTELVAGCGFDDGLAIKFTKK